MSDEIEKKQIELNIQKKTEELFETKTKLENENDDYSKNLNTILPDLFLMYNKEAKEELEKLRAELVAQNVITSQFQSECLLKAAKELEFTLRTYPSLCEGAGVYNAFNNSICPSSLPGGAPTKCEAMSLSIMERFTHSWKSDLNTPRSAGDATVDTNNEIFFKRVTACVDALRAYSVFESPGWDSYRRAEIAQGVPRACILPDDAPPPPPPPTPPPFNIYYDTVPIGPYRYVIGPILDFQNIEGRVFIYIKCYNDASYTTGTYFWVYRSQSEGLYRVFFKIVPNSSIEKGYDYTQATLVHFKLQVALCKYYERHNNRGRKNPIMLNTLPRLNYFMKNMSYLQKINFLDTFPGAIIQPSYYSRPSHNNPVWGGNAPHCANPPPVVQPVPGQPPPPECCYVCLAPAFQSPVPAAPIAPNTQHSGMIGHYYMIDAKYKLIIHKGFPMNPYAGMQEIRNDPDYDSELDFFVNHDTTNRDNFSRLQTQYDTTYPYIFCFTTCCMILPCSLFDLFLDTKMYKKTFWCQGFDNFTSKLSPTMLVTGQAVGTQVPRILSPVLYVIIGAMLEKPDFSLSAFRYNILNVNPVKDYGNEYSRDRRAYVHKLCWLTLMTLGTKDGTVSLYQPFADPYPRTSALTAFQDAIRDVNKEVLQVYERRITTPLDTAILEQRTFVKDKVEKKIKMIKVIAYAAYTSRRDTRVNSVNQLLLDTLNRIRPTNQLNGEIVNKVAQLRVKTSELLGFIQADNPRRVVEIRNKLQELSPEDDSIITGETRASDEILLKAFKFIVKSPAAAASAVIGYVSSPPIGPDGFTEFEDDLSDFALLCLKRNWLCGIMDDAYQAYPTIFNKDNCKLYYLNNNGDFVYKGRNDTSCFNPSNIPPGFFPYLLKSSFDEKRPLDANDKITPEVDATVVTLAHIYRLDCFYIKIPGNITKSMSILFQVSSTISHTRDAPIRIIYGMDMQKIPIGCIPDLPEALDKAPVGAEAPQPPPGPPPPSPHDDAADTAAEMSPATPGPPGPPPPSPPADTAAEMSPQSPLPKPPPKPSKRRRKGGTLEKRTKFNEDQTYSYLTSPYTPCSTYTRVSSHGGLISGKMMEYFFGRYLQLPSFFKNFLQHLQICHQYTTTALIYLANVPPYNLLTIEPNSTFLNAFVEHFQGIVPADDLAATLNELAATLNEKTADIQAIYDCVIDDFIVDPDILDDGTTVQSDSKSGSTTSSKSSRDYCSYDFEDIRLNRDPLCHFLSKTPEESEKCSQPDQDSIDDDSNYDRVGLAPDEADMPGSNNASDAAAAAAADMPGADNGIPGGGGNKPRLTTVATTKRNRKYKSRSSPKRKSKSKSKSRHRRNSKITNKTFCRKRKSYLSRKPFKKQTLKKGVKH